MELSPYMLMWASFIMGVTLLISYNMLHVLNCLIFLELLVLFNFWLMMTSLMELWPPFIMAYFVVTVASAALGLSVLISVCRSHGQDYLFKYNITF